MSIADRIAAEHEWAPFWCKCGTAVHDANHLTTRKMRDLHTRHVAAVTEAAVRAQIAADLEAERNRYRRAHQSAVVDHFAHDYCRWVGGAEALTTAARIAEGGHQ